MAKVYAAKTSFAGGELSPNLYARTDLAQYQIGVKTLQNFIVTPQGSIINRPGLSRWRGNKYYNAVKLIPFIFSEEDSCVLAFYDRAVDVYIGASSGAKFHSTITGSPYTASHLNKLRWLQSGDVIYLFHPDVPVYMLLRTGGTWKFRRVTFDEGPFDEVNANSDNILSFTHDPSLNYGDGHGFRLNSNFDMSSYIEVGKRLYIERDVKGASYDLEIEQDKNGANNDPEAEHNWAYVSNVFGAFTYRTSGKWQGKLFVQRSRPDSNQSGKVEKRENWEDFKVHESKKDAEENFSYSGTVEEYCNYYRFRFVGDKKYAPLSVAFNYEGGITNHIFRVEQVIDSYHAIVYLQETPGVKDRQGITDSTTFQTDAWAFESFSAKKGYPSMGIFHQERLVLANTYDNPQGIWMSKPASWHNFGMSIPAKDDDAIHITLASKEINEIRGLASRGDLLIFTAGGEWTAKAGSKSDVFTPSSIVVTPSGYAGSANIQPLEVEDITLFIQRQATKVRSIGYSLDVDGYASRDVSILSEHMFANNKIIAWAYQQEPWSLVWCVLEDGTCATLTLQKEHQVTAWSRQVFAEAKIKDVCCIPGETQDLVYFAVERASGIQIEQLMERGFETVDIALYAGYYRDFYDTGYLPIHSIMETLDLEVGGGGSSIQGRYKHVPAMTLRLLNTKTLKGCVITEDTIANPVLDELQFPLQNSPGRYNDGLYSGDVRFVPQGGVGRTCRIRLENDAPTPVQILGIFPEIVIEEEDVSLNNGGQS